jgi:uncharacterized protein (DUF58 family)
VVTSAATDTVDARVYATLAHLRGLEGRARGVNFLPRQPAKSVLNGRHASRMRGRGLNFEEIRGYLAGDDIRSIDWKVTARKGGPHVRVYTEERDRPALLLVDQRLTMFFGSRLNMKSVTAAEAAAIAAWRILDVGDRVGGIVFGDDDMVEIRPQRNRRTVHALLAAIAEMNAALRADLPAPEAPALLNRPLQAAVRIAKHDHLIVVLSDFDGIDGRTHRIVSGMAQHNDVVLVLIHDPIAQELPADLQMTVSDGRLQVQLDTQAGQVHKLLRDFAAGRLQQILDWQTELGVPVLPLSAGEETLPQVRRLLGHLAVRRAVRGRGR